VSWAGLESISERQAILGSEHFPGPKIEREQAGAKCSWQEGLVGPKIECQ
jgi:hypothetical protein